jgi:hypothetical protein
MRSRLLAELQAEKGELLSELPTPPAPPVHPRPTCKPKRQDYIPWVATGVIGVVLIGLLVSRQPAPALAATLVAGIQVCRGRPDDVRVEQRDPFDM